MNVLYRCAGPGCEETMTSGDGWWLMWASYDGRTVPSLALAPWNSKLASEVGALPVCGEHCAQRLQSQFMGNLQQNQTERERKG